MKGSTSFVCQYCCKDIIRQLQDEVDVLKAELAQIESPSECRSQLPKRQSKSRRRRRQGCSPNPSATAEQAEPSPGEPSPDKVCVDSSSVNINSESSFGVRVGGDRRVRVKKK